MVNLARFILLIQILFLCYPRHQKRSKFFSGKAAHTAFGVAADDFKVSGTQAVESLFADGNAPGGSGCGAEIRSLSEKSRRTKKERKKQFHGGDLPFQ